MQRATEIAERRIAEHTFTRGDIESMGGSDATAALLMVEGLEQATDDPQLVRYISQQIALVPPFFYVGAWEGIMQRIAERI